MTELNLNQLFDVAQATDLLDAVEHALRQTNHNQVADELVKLQQDCGIAIDQEINGTTEIAAGPESAKLIAAYVPPTIERISDLSRHLEEKLTNPPLYKNYVAFLDTSTLSMAPPARSKPRQSFKPQ